MSRFRRSAIALVASAGLVLTGCSATEGSSSAESASASGAAGSEAAAESAGTVTVEDNYGTQEVPVDPETVVALDNRTFEVLHDWNVDLAAAPLDLLPKGADWYSEEDGTLNVGNHREPNLEIITATQPDLIVSGQRFATHDEDIKKLNPDTPLVDFEPREGQAWDQELVRQVTELGKIFDKEEESQELVDEFNAALERAREAYDPAKKVMAVNVSGGEIGYIAPGVGRTYGFLFDLVGMTPALEVAGSSSNHEGDDISVEAIAQSNPDILLVLDRDAAVQSTDPATYTAAENVIRDNPALQNVTAVQDEAIYLAPADTYTNESIITYTEILNGMADLFESQK